ncbi:MAG: hypothetical protein KDD64_07560 [Bdellovibrionales bacterium]|nr:hypothetical protein [Bdellovibrionales bacterium]
MKKSTIAPVDRSRDFKLSELFFSTTDSKGVITGFNDIFVSISAFQSKDLLQQPHNVIRHPDMPRCVFKLLWDYLLAGKPIGAYVKNMAQTGEYYWVYALVTPIQGGFLSMRLKPSTDIFPVVKSLYAELLKTELSYGKDWRQGMIEAGTLLEKKIKELNFESYDDFMTISLREEIRSRNAHLGRDQAVTRGSFSSIFKELDGLFKLREQMSEMRSFFDNMGFQISRAAVNASIVAARLAEKGRALGVISEEVSHVATGINSESEIFTKEMNHLNSALLETSFSVSFCTLAKEIQEYFQETKKQSSLSLHEERLQFGASIDELMGQVQEGFEHALSTSIKNIRSLISTLHDFESFREALAKLLLNLQLGYVTGKTISVRMDGGEQFVMLLQNIVEISEQARIQLGQVETSVKKVTNLASNWEKTSSALLR